MSLFAYMASEGVERSANGIAAKIRKEAEQAFADRMFNKKVDADNASQKQAHQNNVDLSKQEHQQGLLRDKQRFEQNKEVAKITAASKASKAKDDTKKNQIDYYKTMIKKTQDELKLMQESGATTEDMRPLINQLNSYTNEYSGLVGIEKPRPSASPDPENLINQALAHNNLEDTPENRNKVIASLSQHPKTAGLFTDYQATPPPSITPTDNRTPAPAGNAPSAAPYQGLEAQLADKDYESSKTVLAEREAEQQQFNQDYANSKQGLDAQRASQRLQQISSKLRNSGLLGSVNPRELAEAQQLIEILRKSGMTPAEEQQAAIIEQHIQSRLN